MAIGRNIFFVEAEAGQEINNFIEELIEIRKNKKWDVIGKFNNVMIEIGLLTVSQDAVKYYWETVIKL